jgi:hypothetical protein
MSFGAVQGIHYPPSYMGLGAATGNSAITTHTIDAADEKFACLFRVGKTGTLRTIHTCINTVTQAPAGGLKVSLQGVNNAVTPSRPDGVISHFRVGTSGITSGAWFNPGTLTSDGTATGAKRTVTRGEWITVVWEFNAFATGDSLFMRVFFLPSPRLSLIGQAYTLLQTGGTWNASNQSVIDIALEYDDGTYAYQGDMVLGASDFITASFGSNTTPTEVGLRITPTAPIRASGIYASLLLVSDCDLVLYDAANTVLAASSLNGNRKSGGSSTTPFYGDFGLDVATQPILQPGQTYRVTVKGVQAGFNGCPAFVTNDAATMNQFPLGTSCIATQRTGTGAWTDTATRRYLMGLVVSGFSAGGGRRGRLRTA